MGFFAAENLVLNFSNERVDAHNFWPKKGNFKGEQMFAARLSQKDGLAPFRAIAIGHNDDAEYQRCVGHLLDALDQIPNRPDYAFDHFFRIIDVAGSSLIPTNGIKGVVQGASSALLLEDKEAWEQIIDVLCAHMPLRTYEFLAKRLINLSDTGSEEHKRLHKRSVHTLGSKFFNAFSAKYALDINGNFIANAAEENRANAAKLLKLYMSGKPGTRLKTASDPALDLTKQPNVPNFARRSEVLASLLLFTIRNERAHGSVISPFRTSKSTLGRYESYYFIMLLAYTFALGILSLRFKCISLPNILTGLQENIEVQKAFFSK